MEDNELRHSCMLEESRRVAISEFFSVDLLANAVYMLLD